MTAAYWHWSAREAATMTVSRVSLVPSASARMDPIRHGLAPLAQ